MTTDQMLHELMSLGEVRLSKSYYKDIITICMDFRPCDQIGSSLAFTESYYKHSPQDERDSAINRVVERVYDHVRSKM